RSSSGRCAHFQRPLTEGHPQVLIIAHLWAAPFATALRNNGGRVVASGRIPVDALLESLGAIERS
ncbi:hypothetical protein R3P94_23215, partial [Gordonia amicalis]|nr:hypothetical protein [Gordonia amicalis]